MSDFIAKVVAELDTSQIEGKIKALGGQQITFNNIRFDVSAITSQLESAIGKHRFEFKMDTSKIAADAKSAAASIEHSFSKKFGSTDPFGQIANSLKSGKIDAQIARVTAQYEKLGSTGHSKLISIKADIEQLNALQSRMGTQSGTELVSSYEKFNSVLSRVKASLTTVSAESKTVASALQITKLDNQIATWMSSNTRAAKEFGGQIDQLRSKLAGFKSAGNTPLSEVNSVRTQFETIQAQAVAAGKVGKTLGSSFSNVFATARNYITAYTIINRSIRALKDMYQNVYNIDTQMTELKKVTNETGDAYSRFLKNAAPSARQIGTSVADYIKSTSGFARLGYSMSEAQELAKTANVYAVVGDELNGIDDATKNIISTMTAFHVESSDVMSIVDKFNEVGNNFAISSGGIGDALERSASSLAAANNSLDQSIALITAANTVVQNPEAIGTGFKTMTMRIRGAKTELEDAGLETEGMATSTAKLREEIKALSGVDIMLNDTTFKSTYDILDELSIKWKDLTDIQQAAITELVAGKRQGNVMSSLMTNFDIAREALKASSGAEGSAMAEHTKWMDSLEAKTQRLKATWESFSVAFLDSSFLKGLVDAGTSALGVVTSLVDKFGTLPVILGAVSTAMSFKNAGIFKNVGGELHAFGYKVFDIFSGVKGQINAIMDKSATLSFTPGFTNDLDADIAALNRFDAVIRRNGTQNILSTINQTMAGSSQTAKEFAETYGYTARKEFGAFAGQAQLAQVSIDAQGKSLTNVRKLLNTYNKGFEETNYTQKDFAKAVSASNKSLGGYFQSLEGGEATMGGFFKYSAGAAVKNFGLNIGRTFLNGLAGFGIGAAVSLVGNLVGSLIDEIIHHEEKLIKKSEEAGQAIASISDGFKSKASIIEDTADRFAELSQGIDSLTGKNKSLTTAEYSEFLSISNQLAETFPMLNRSYDENGNAIVRLGGSADSVVSSLQNLLDVERQIARQEITEQLPDLYKGLKVKSDNNQSEIDKLQKKKDDYQKIVDAFNSGDLGIKWDGNNANLLTSGDYTGMLLDVYDDSVLKLSSKSTSVNKQIAKAYRDAAERLGLEIKEDLVVGDGKNALSIDWSGMSEAEIEAAKSQISMEINALSARYEAEIGRLNNQIQTKVNENKQNWSGMLSGISSWMSTDSTYLALNDEMRGIAQSMVNNIDFTNLGFSSFDDVKTYVADNIISKLQSATPDVQEAFSAMMSMPTDTGAVSDYMQSIYAQAIKIARNSDFENVDEVLSVTGLTDVVKKYQDAKDDILRTLDDKLAEQYGKNTPEYTAAIERLKKSLDGLTPDQLLNARDLAGRFGIETLKELQAALDGQILEASVDIKLEKEGFEGVVSAMNEAMSATGLTGYSITSLIKRYQGLEHYDASKLFERTSRGISLNAKALRELESEYANQQKSSNQRHLDTLIQQYDALTRKIDRTADAEKKRSLLADRDDLSDRINDARVLAAQYDALTSSYNRWLSAMSQPGSDDAFNQISSGFSKAKELYEQGKVGGDAFRSFVQMMTDEDLSGASVDQIEEAYQRGLPAMKRYFDESIGEAARLERFVNDAVSASSKYGESWFTQDAEGKYHIDIGVDGEADLAKALGEMQGFEVSTEEVKKMLEALREFGFDIEFDSAYASLEQLGLTIEECKDKLNDLGFDADINVESNSLFAAKNEIIEAKSLFDSFPKLENGSIDLSVEGAAEAQALLIACIERKQELSQPEILNIDVSGASEGIQHAFGLLSQLQTNINTLEIQKAIGVDTSKTQANIQNLVAALNSIDDKEIRAALNLDTSSVQSAFDSVSSTDLNIEAGINLDSSAIDTLQFMIHRVPVYFIPNTAQVDAEAAKTDGGQRKTLFKANTSQLSAVQSITSGGTRRVVYKGDTSNLPSNLPPLTRVVQYVSTGLSNLAGWMGITKAKGTSRSQGTAFAKGTWGAKESGVALGGELGQELVVRNGKFFTIGDHSAEFFKYKKDDIIFNAEQTRQILANGRITNGVKRGVSYAEGTAFATGTKGVGGFRTSTKSSASSKKSTSTKKNNSSKKSSSKSSGKSNTSKAATTDTAEKELETIDWIELAIDRIERAIERLKTVATSAYKAITTRLRSTRDEISKVNEEINLQQRAYDRYIQQANSVGLSADLAARVRDGTIDISKYDEDTVKLIKDYQEWYEKALDCSDAIQELHENLASLYEDNFNNVKTDYEHQLKMLDHLTKSYETGIDELEAKGYLESTRYYESLQNVERQNIAVMQNELSDLTRLFTEAMDSGKIEERSEAWYSFQAAINEVKESIDEANVKLLEYKKTMREIEWGYFDYVQDRIEHIVSESDFLIDLLGSNTTLYNHRGQFNDRGLATTGLHAQNYNVYMSQADQYADEILKLNKQIAADPYNTTLIERREKLLELQQKSILAAEDEKEAIVDLVEEGIEIELDALKDLIDAYTDSLDSAKDLYDYQRKITDKTSDIASLQKQLAAYENDTSEETRSKIQKIRVDLAEAEQDLEEAEYDRYIKDAKKMLDNLYDEYEGILNERLDNVDALIADMIETVNLNSSDINSTLHQVSSEVGYTMTRSMQDVWSNGGSAYNIVSLYGNNFTSQLTTVNQVLNAIHATVAAMQNASNQTAQTTVGKTTTVTPPVAPAVTQTTPPQNTNTVAQQKTITVGGKINAQGAPIYSYAGDTRGLKQYFAKDPIYTVLQEKNGYLLVRHHKLSQGLTGWFKKSDVKAYKTGGLVDYTGLAQVDGTPSNPELMLNARDTRNFIGLRDALRSASQKTLTIGTQRFAGITPNISGVADISGLIGRIGGHKTSVGGANNTFGDINITIDHVENYDDFVRQLQKDRQFERFIQSMTVDRLAGKSSLSKHKYFQ